MGEIRDMGKGSTRRDFLRAAALFGLGIISWTTMSKPGRLGPNETTAPFPCERCPALSSCSMPDSLQARDVLGPRASTVNAPRDVPPRRLCVESGLLKLTAQKRS